MDFLNKQEELKKILKSITDATEKNIIEKRKNFEHITLLVGTILGFSIALTTTTNGKPDCFLVLSWLVDVVAIIIGILYLIIESESRYYRTFIGADKQIDLINKNEIEINNLRKTLWKDMYKAFLDVSSGENIKEKLFILFAKYQHGIEICFYITFILSLILLVLSFL